jgi:glycine betaine/choline ABC-type transport system substrate-binding protein
LALFGRRGQRALPVLLAALLVGCGGGGAQSTQRTDLAVGATSDPQSIVLANLYAAALRYFGSPAHVQVVADPLAKLDAGELSVVPGLTGQLLATFAPGATVRSDEQVYKTMVAALPEGITVGDYTTAAEDKPAAAVSASTAAAWRGHQLGDLVDHCAQVRPGAVRGAPPPTRVGTCRPPAVREYPDSATLFAALAGGEINVAWTTTAQPEVPDDVVVLADRKPVLLPAENAVPLYRRNELDPRQVLALNQIAGALDTAALKQLRGQVVDGADPRTVAEAWLAENPLGR